jgi:LuxR family maltose regulon positive regulatory protein
VHERAAAPAPSRRRPRERRILDAGTRGRDDHTIAPALVERARLSARLDAAVALPLTLVAAAPGSGKTVALREWARQRPAPGVAWVRLDADVSGPAALWARLAPALALPGAPAARRAAAAAPVSARDVAALAEAQLADRSAPVVLVLDDAHEADRDTLTAVLNELLGHPALRVVLSTRVDPGLPLHRLRVEGRMTELRGAELAFTTDEAGTMLALQDVALTAPDLDLLVRRTEGWAAGLRLATLLLCDHPEPGHAVAEFAGDDRAVVAFLVHEVLDRQPPAVREMLVRTSVLDRVSGPLADALTGGHDGQAMLDDLVRRNAFVEPLDRRGRWYRYHALFADLLRAQLRQRGPDACAEQHRRAARHFARAGRPRPALRHAGEAGDWDLVDALVRDHGVALRADGARGDLEETLGRVPPDALRSRPFAALAAATGALERGDAGASRSLAALAAEAAPSLAGARRRELVAGLALLRAQAALAEGDAGTVRHQATQALRLAAWPGTTAAAVRAVALTVLGEVLVAEGDPTAEAQLRSAAVAARAAGLGALVRRADALRSWSYALDGHLRQAGLAAGRLIDGDEPADAEAHLARALVAAELGDVAGAAAASRQAAAAIASDPGDGLAPLALELVRCRTAQLTGVDERQAMLHALERLTAGRPPPARLAELATAARVVLLTGLGRAADAEAAAAAAPSGRTGTLAVAHAGARLAAGAPGPAYVEALAVSDRGASPSVPVAVAALATAACAADAAGDRPAALRAVERALDLAEHDGLRLALADACPALEPLLRHVLRFGTSHRALVGDVLELAATGTARVPATPAVPLREPLSERELAVLRFLPTMLTSQEIAAELFVTLNTVKSHLRNVYRKLGVGGRREAVERGRELGLLAPSSRG